MLRAVVGQELLSAPYSRMAAGVQVLQMWVEGPLWRYGCSRPQQRDGAKTAVHGWSGNMVHTRGEKEEEEKIKRTRRKKMVPTLPLPPTKLAFIRPWESRDERAHGLENRDGTASDSEAEEKWEYGSLLPWRDPSWPLPLGPMF